MSDNKIEVGQGSAGDSVKRRWQKEGKGTSLKAFARKLASDGDQLAKDWFDCKNGALNAERSDKNRARVEIESAATRAAHRKSKK